MPIAEFAYNNTIYSSTKTISFFANFVYNCNRMSVYEKDKKTRTGRDKKNKDTRTREDKKTSRKQGWSNE